VSHSTWVQPRGSKQINLWKQAQRLFTVALIRTHFALRQKDRNQFDIRIYSLTPHSSNLQDRKCAYHHWV